MTDFARLFNDARSAQIVVGTKELRELSWDLAGTGNTTGLDLAPWLDPTRRQKLMRRECFYMGFGSLTP